MNKKYEEIHIQAIAETIREKTGSEDSFKVSDMASGVNEVYEAGYNQYESDWWDRFQNYGERTQYVQAFSYGYPYECYNPKYPLRGSVNTAFGYGKIKDVKVPILEATNIQQLCRWNGNIERIPELNISESTNINDNPFYYATALKHIKLTGVLAGSLSFAESPLTAESMKSIILCMKDYAEDTTNHYKYTITFKTSAFDVLEAEGATAEYNGVACTWAELIDNKKWNLVKA